MDSDTFQYVGIEYHELNNHVRECWKYISELLRNFLLLQILLVSLMFLGGGLIEVDGIHVQMKPIQSIIPDQSLVILPLMFIGCMGSFGAVAQNLRLFANATRFVRRAAFLETIDGFAKDERADASLGRTFPPNRYMSEKLYVGGEGFDWLRILLSGTYVIFGCLWLFYFYAFEIAGHIH